MGWCVDSVECIALVNRNLWERRDLLAPGDDFSQPEQSGCGTVWRSNGDIRLSLPASRFQIPVN